jgi:trehalose 6-phosphate synthase
MLYATPHQPVFDAGWRREWAAYVHYNRRFAEAIAQDAAPGAKVLVQDYHLTLAPKQLRELRPDLTIGHFSHTPWAPAEYFRMLPDAIARDGLLGVLGADHAGFHSPRWGNAFLDCCRDVLGAEVDYVSRTVRLEGRTSRIGVHPLGVDAPGMRARAAAPDVESRRTALLDQIGDLTTIVRIDRTELSKNIERGLLAYRELLRTRPEWRGRIVHVAFAYPSRHDLPEYREYTAAVLRLADEIDAEFATETWRPLVLHVDDDYARSLAAYSIADILLVNPVRDGMNLVAKEGPLLSSRECALVLSTEAGAADELGDAALLVNPFDVSQTACALHEALLMPRAERAARAEQLRAGATALPPHEWLAEQLAAL